MKPTRSDEPAKLERPIPDAYWIIPGRLLAGPYPGSRLESLIRQRALRFLAGGITLFLDLTEEGEMPPYAHWLDEAARHLRMPIPDFGVPTPEQMVQTVKRSSPLQPVQHLCQSVQPGIPADRRLVSTSLWPHRNHVRRLSSQKIPRPDRFSRSPTCHEASPMPYPPTSHRRLTKPVRSPRGR
jgi:hypothetical protein